MSATALYKALVDAGAREELAEKAADDLPSAGELATRADLAELKADLTLRIVIVVGIIVGVSHAILLAILLAVLRLTPG